MKSSGGFDARRLRSRGPRHWRLRLGAGCAALAATLGVLLAMAGTATLLGRPPAIAGLDESPGTAAFILGLGLLLLWAGIRVWRLCRRRLHRPSDLSLSPELMKKRD